MLTWTNKYPSVLIQIKILPIYLDWHVLNSLIIAIILIVFHTCAVFNKEVDGVNAAA